ncbi:MAG: ATP-binding protein [Terriglobales bacterium]
MSCSLFVALFLGGIMATATTLPSARKLLSPYAFAIPGAALLALLVWPPLLTRVTDASFIPHRFCYLSNPPLVWLNVVADSLIGLAYVAISATLAYLVHRARRDIPFSWMFLAFGLFIVACGMTHFMEVITTIGPALYWLAGDVKVITAVASVATAIALPTLVPKTMDLLASTRVAGDQRKELESAYGRLNELEQIGSQLRSKAAAGTVSWQWDLKTNRVSWSGDLQRVFGYPADKLSMANDVFAVIHPEDRAEVHAALEDAISRRTDYDAEFRVVQPDGSVHWLIGRGHVHSTAGGEADCIVGVNLDVTSRKHAEDALRHSERLAVSGRLAATIAHEINNPLAAVTNLLYLIHNSAADAPVRNFVELAQEELGRVSHIVRQTLGFHRDSVAPSPVQMSAVIENVISLHHPQLRAKNITLEHRIHSEVPVMALGGDLRQVVANLLQNAIDAVPEGGRIRVSLARAEVHGREGVRLIMADDGCGIPDNVRAKVFEPFVTTKGEKGTGLGLWVVEGIVSSYGGFIRYRTQVAEGRSGTVFSAFLPADRREESAVELSA